MQFTIHYETEDTTADVETNPWVIMVWERKYKTKATRIGQEGLGVEDVAFMAWEASKLHGITVPISFETFAQGIRKLEVRSDDTSRPTNAAPSDE